VPTFLLRVKDLALLKVANDLKKSAFQSEFNSISILANLLNDKEFSVGEISLHLMREALIERNIEYKKEAEDQEFVQVEELQCPWQYPPVNHPNTLLLWKGY
jgi:hypothetical protein